MKDLNIHLLVSFSLLLYALSSCSGTRVETSENYEVVKFPDGSVAYLNFNSSVEFNKAFAQRAVKLDGEAYFKVQEGEVPFVINTELGEIIVLGTAFNVKSDGDELVVEVEKGEVKLETKGSEKKVDRGKRAKYKKNEVEVEIGEAKFKFKGWLTKLKIEWKKIEKDLDKSSEQLGEDLLEAGKDIKKGFKKIEVN